MVHVYSQMSNGLIFSIQHINTHSFTNSFTLIITLKPL